jgi:hypothetical protein
MELGANAREIGAGEQMQKSFSIVSAATRAGKALLFLRLRDSRPQVNVLSLVSTPPG